MKNRVKGLLFTIFLLFFFSCPTYGEEITTVYIGTGEKTYKGGKLSLEKTYLSVGGAQVLKTIDYTLPSKDRTTITYLFTDHLSSTAVTANQTGKPVSFYAYYPYGEIRTSNSSNNTSPDRLYTSQRKDTLSNLYFYNARYYNLLTSRFISADKAQGPNRYSYVGNNPIMRNDPSGNKYCDTEENCRYDEIIFEIQRREDKRREIDKISLALAKGWYIAQGEKIGGIRNPEIWKYTAQNIYEYINYLSENNEVVKNGAYGEYKLFNPETGESLSDTQIRDIFKTRRQKN